MNCMVTQSGREYHLDGAGTAQNAHDIEDIAHALSQINRFVGHTRRPYSVAEHSLLVCDVLRAMGTSLRVQLAGLMHDAHEAYLGDVSTPLKSALGLAWAELEHVHALRVRQAYHLMDTFDSHAQVIKHADLVALATERRDLMAYQTGVHAPWPILDTRGHEVPACSQRLSGGFRSEKAATDWRCAFLDRYHHLRAQIALEC